MDHAHRLPATVRAVRGAALGLVTAAIGVSAHLIGVGDLPDTGPTLGVAALVAWAGSALADRQRGPAATVAALAAGQALVHVVLLLPARLVHREPLGGGSSSLTLLAAYAGAVLVIGVLLAGADTALLAVFDVVRVVLRRARTTVPVRVPLWVGAVPAVAHDGAKDVLLRRTRSRRGPPRLG